MNYYQKMKTKITSQNKQYEMPLIHRRKLNNNDCSILESKAKENLYRLSQDICEPQKQILLEKQIQGNYCMKNDFKKQIANQLIKISFSPWNQKYNKENIEELQKHNLQKNNNLKKKVKNSEKQKKRIQQKIQRCLSLKVQSCMQSQQTEQKLQSCSIHETSKQNLKKKKEKYTNQNQQYQRFLSSKQNEYIEIITCIKRRKKENSQSIHQDEFTMPINSTNYLKHDSIKQFEEEVEAMKQTDCSTLQLKRHSEALPRKKYTINDTNNTEFISTKKDHERIHEKEKKRKNNSKNTNKTVFSKMLPSMSSQKSVSIVLLKNNQFKPTNQNPLKHWIKLPKKNSIKKMKNTEDEYYSSNPLTRLLYEKYIRTINVTHCGQEQISHYQSEKKYHLY